MLCLLMLAFAGMGARLFFLQIVEAPAYAKLASSQRAAVITFPARRGTILARGGESLGISVDLQTVYADPSLVEAPAREARRLAPVLDMGTRRIARLLRGTRPGSRFEYVARQIGPRKAAAVRRLDLPGIYLEAEPKRLYPNRRLASQVLGFVGTDGAGLAGIENQYESILRGRPGRMTLEQDPSGRPLPQADFSYDRPTAGRSLFLTIDKDIQYLTELALADAARRYGAQSGTAIVMAPGTGEVLAMANVPSFDPNSFAEAPQEAQRNRAVTDVFEPGSAYKIVAAAAALEERVVTPRTTFVVPDELPYADRVFHDSHWHETEEMTVAEIIEQSSNVGTIKIGLELGGERLDDYVRRFGFGTPTGLDFPGESGGIVLPRKDWSGSTIATVPIGQGIAVTAMQMASAYSTLANDGVWVEPQLLHATVDGEGRAHRSAPSDPRRVVSRRTARQMTKILTGVVDEGTGIEAQIPGYEVAGKTGTAQKPLPTGGYGNSYVATFAGYAPARDPQVAVIVVLDDPVPIWGGLTAAPTFRTITQFALRHLGVPPTGNASRAAAEIEADQRGAEDIRD